MIKNVEKFGAEAEPDIFCEVKLFLQTDVRLRGAETVIVGIQPEVAFAMVQLGLSLKGVATALDLEEGLAFLDTRAREHMSRGR